MNTFSRNTISKLYNIVSAPVPTTQDALAERLQSVRDTTSLLYIRVMENMGYGQQERLKKKQKKRSNRQRLKRRRGKDQHQPKSNNTMMMSDMIRLQK